MKTIYAVCAGLVFALGINAALAAGPCNPKVNVVQVQAVIPSEYKMMLGKDSPIRFTSNADGDTTSVSAPGQSVCVGPNKDQFPDNVTFYVYNPKYPEASSGLTISPLAHPTAGNTAYTFQPTWEKTDPGTLGVSSVSVGDDGAYFEIIAP